MKHREYAVETNRGNGDILDLVGLIRDDGQRPDITDENDKYADHK